MQYEESPWIPSELKTIHSKIREEQTMDFHLVAICSSVTAAAGGGSELWAASVLSKVADGRPAAWGRRGAQHSKARWVARPRMHAGRLLQIAF